jgi:hypothetical protein
VTTVSTFSAIDPAATGCNDSNSLKVYAMCTDTVFLRDTTDGDVFAVFPGIAATVGDPGSMTCYAHIGQHGAAAFDYCYDCDEVTDPEEYADLEAELLSIGYDVRVVPKDLINDDVYSDERRLQLER